MGKVINSDENLNTHDKTINFTDTFTKKEINLHKEKRK